MPPASNTNRVRLRQAVELDQLFKHAFQLVEPDHVRPVRRGVVGVLAGLHEDGGTGDAAALPRQIEPVVARRFKADATRQLVALSLLVHFLNYLVFMLFKKRHWRFAGRMDISDRDVIPFRWDLSRREQLGQLLSGEAEVFPAGYLEDLRETAAKVVARAGDGDLVFVGRSPENIFDYVSGAFSELKSRRSLTLLQGSFSRIPDDLTLSELEPILGYFRSERIDPQSLASSGKVVRFVDVVAYGRTFLWLVRTIRAWSERERADWNAVKRRIGFIGLTSRTKNSPNTYRWQQDDAWLQHGENIFVKNVSVHRFVLNYFADTGPKVTPSHNRHRWGSEEALRPPREEERLMALRGAVQLYDLGKDRTERSLFARVLAEQPEMSEPWLRRLVLELKANK